MYGHENSTIVDEDEAGENENGNENGKGDTEDEDHENDEDDGDKNYENDDDDYDDNEDKEEDEAEEENEQDDDNDDDVEDDEENDVMEDGETDKQEDVADITPIGDGTDTASQNTLTGTRAYVTTESSTYPTNSLGHQSSFVTPGYKSTSDAVLITTTLRVELSKHRYGILFQF